MRVKTLNTTYTYDGVSLPVPDHLLGNDAALRAFHTTLYPAIATADVVQTTDGDGNIVMEYRRSVGTKG